MPLRHSSNLSRAWLAAIVAAAALCFILANRAVATDAVKPAVAAFMLVDQDGRSFTDADLRDRPTVIHFGFTHCPVVCPTTFYEVTERLNDLGPLADQIRFVFVTIDPQRDTPRVCRQLC